MIQEETRRKLRELNLDDMLSIYDVQIKDPSVVMLSFDERFEMMVDYVYTQKYNAKIKRLTNRARFRFPNADITSIIYEKRRLDRSLMTELSVGGFMDTATNIVFQGYTGSGKTFLSCALGKQMCTRLKRVFYTRLPDLLMKYDEAKNISLKQVEKLLNKMSRFDLLILDEWLMEELSKEEEHFIFELIERRYDNVSTIFATQYRKEDWLDRLGSNVHAEAITDRIVHNSIWIEMGDTNVREILGKETVSR